MVKLSRAASKKGIVRYRTVADTATKNDDYVHERGRLVFRRGDVKKRIRVSIVGDTTSEADEQFSARLFDAERLRLRKKIGAVTILDDDAPAACANGIDDDADGVIDALDPGCADASDTSERGLTACDDGEDNDGDGASDYLVDATGDAQCAEPGDDSELGSPACGDGLDNDADGVADSADPGCASPSDGTQQGTSHRDDGLDNDGDEAIDFRADGLGDPQCTAPTDSDEAT